MSKKLKYLAELFNTIPLLFFIAFLLIGFISYINIFPSGYIFSGADVVQFFRLDKFLYELKYVWTNSLGEGMFLQYYSYIIYYFVIAVISNMLNLSVSAQSFLYFFLFLFGSFCSFFLGLYSLRFKIPVENFVKFIFSLVYTFNVYTLYVFYYTWGYSPFLFLYILIPLLFPLTLIFFEKSEKQLNKKYMFYLSGVFFLTNIANGNFSFFVSFNIINLIYVVSLFFYLSYPLKTFIKNVVIFYVLYGLCVSWSVLPQLVEMLKFSSAISSGNVSFDFSNWVIWQATKFSDLFNIIKLDSFNDFSILNWGALYYIFLFLFLLNSVGQKNSLRNIYLLLLFICLTLLNKGVGLFYTENINAFFSNPLLLSLKSYDKILVFVPYLILISIYLCVDIKKFYHKILLSCLFVFSLLISYPLLTGDIQTKYSSAFNSIEHTYKDASYSYIHNIPKDYLEVSSYINSSESTGKIFHLPYSVVNSVGWVNLSRWGVVGVDPTAQLFNLPSINVNIFNAFGSWNYGKYWNTDLSIKPSWIVKLAGLMGSSYVLYHKDVESKFYDLTFNKVLYMERVGDIERVFTKENFILYKIKSSYFYNYLYHPTRIYISSNIYDSMPEILSLDLPTENYKILIMSENSFTDTTLSRLNLDTNIEVSSVKINPTKYLVEINNLSLENSKDLFPLVFNESFHYGWTIIPANVTIFEKVKFLINNSLIFDHVQGNGYSNVWILNSQNICDYKYTCVRDQNNNVSVNLSIVFWPQYIYFITLFISISTVCILYLVFFYSRIFYHADQ